MLPAIRNSIFTKILCYNLRICTISSSCVIQDSCIDLRSSSKLLSNHLKLGKIANAQKVFDEMPQRDIVAWSIMVHGYAKNGLNKQALELFSCFRNSGLVPNSFMLVGVLVAVVGLQYLVLAQCVHGVVVKYGLVSDSIVATAMLDAYAKCGSVFNSCKMFKQMDSPSLVSSNALLSGMVHNELFKEAVKAFVEFRRFGLVPNSVTMLTLFQGCLAQESRILCESMHVLVVKVGLISELAVNNSLLGVYTCLKDLVAANKIFNEMGCKDVISWTIMMGLLNDLEYASDAISLFHQMRNNSVKYDNVTMVNLIGSCANLGDLRKGKQVHAQAIISGYVSDINILNSIITLYAKCGDLPLSRAVFNQANERSLVSWSAIISGCVQNGQPQEAINLLLKLRTDYKSCFDLVTLVSALKASGDLAFLVFSQQLHCYAFKTGFPHHRSVLNSLISAYSKCGDVELACDVFRFMGDIRDVVSWNAIINGLGINGHGTMAVNLFHEMLKGQQIPDNATYISVLNACSHSGLVDDGLKIFQQMVEEHRIIPSQELVGCIVDLLARAGCLSDVSGYISGFLNLMGPNAWKALLSGCLLHGNVEMVEFVAQRMVEKDPKNSEILVLVSNIFASFGRFQDAEGLRLRIDDNRLVKSPGISLLDNIPHDYG